MSGEAGQKSPEGTALLETCESCTALPDFYLIQPRVSSGNCHWEIAKGGERIVRFLEGKRTVECPLQNQFWRVGFVWSVPVSSKENDRAWGKRIMGGGVQNLGGPS